jgi:hypothetical protein
VDAELVLDRVVCDPVHSRPVPLEPAACRDLSQLACDGVRQSKALHVSSYVLDGPDASRVNSRHEKLLSQASVELNSKPSAEVGRAEVRVGKHRGDAREWDHHPDGGVGE